MAMYALLIFIRELHGFRLYIQKSFQKNPDFPI